MPELITGTKGTPHITSTQDRSIYEKIIGKGSYILDDNELLEPELQSNQSLRIRSGMLYHHGSITEVKRNTYDEVTIANGSQGMKRIDLVVLRYTKNPETEIEEMNWVVIQGTPAASDPVAPAYTEGNMQEGDLTDDCPFCEVHLDGIQVTEVVKLMKVLDGSLESLNSKISVKKWESIVHPYSQLSPDNTLTLTICKTANVCTAFVMWTGSVNENSATLDEISVPDEFRPLINAFGYAPAVVGTTQQNGGTRINLTTNGDLSFTTNDRGFTERRVTITYIC